MRRTLTPLAIAVAIAATAPLAAGRASAATPTAEKVTLTFDATTKKLTGLPATLKGGLTSISLTQRAGTFKTAVLVTRLLAKKTDAEIYAADKSDTIPTWMNYHGGVTTRSGATATMTTNLPKGDYVFMVSSSDDTLDGKEPIVRTVVSGTGANGTLPKGTSSIAMKEYGFDTVGLKAGANSVSASNVGKELHFAAMNKLMPGKTMADAKKALESNGPPPPGVFDDAAGQFLAPLQPGGAMTVDLELSKGTYVMVCFVPDKTGKPHFMSGMVKELVVA